MSSRARSRASEISTSICGERVTTYAELERGAASLARRLAAMGVGRGDRVATTLPAGADFARLLHALPKLGAAIVPLNPRLTQPERTAQLEASGVRVVVDRAPSGPEADVRLATSVEPDDVQTVLFTSGSTLSLIHISE